MDFLKFFLNNNKVFLGFVVIFILVFHVGGMLFTDMTFHYLFPMYCLIGAVFLTFLVYDWKRYNKLKNDN